MPPCCEHLLIQLHNLMAGPRLCKITYVFHTLPSTASWYSGSLPFRSMVEELKPLSCVISAFPSNIQVVIVNAGSLRPHRSNGVLWKRTTESDDAQVIIMDQLEEVLRDEGNSPEQVRKNMGRVCFITMKEYLMREKWKGIIPEETARDWLNH
nr:uncharacterized protein CI109_003998 [Kwoniella shandongensis]KAA5527739.1 hypothetical protein CI109_003998 [Kwoniella shandongensis]